MPHRRTLPRARFETLLLPSTPNGCSRRRASPPIGLLMCRSQMAGRVTLIRKQTLSIMQEAIRQRGSLQVKPFPSSHLRRSGGRVTKDGFKRRAAARRATQRQRCSRNGKHGTLCCRLRQLARCSCITSLTVGELHMEANNKRLTLTFPSLLPRLSVRRRV